MLHVADGDSEMVKALHHRERLSRNGDVGCSTNGPLLNVGELFDLGRGRTFGTWTTTCRACARLFILQKITRLCMGPALSFFRHGEPRFSECFMDRLCRAFFTVLGLKLDQKREVFCE